MVKKVCFLIACGVLSFAPQGAAANDEVEGLLNYLIEQHEAGRARGMLGSQAVEASGVKEAQVEASKQTIPTKSEAQGKKAVRHLESGALNELNTQKRRASQY